ncbi:MAG TPA: aminopeptidase N [Sedimenticola thiotaurini]|uniref:Aminopeptidase N n=1 Tax=Sedimenticola thiotaurini TaxID=1543721 RepID=A0A831W9S8_9GAMM|nr:aminopeptidase N [Sedimenticola thiotaurini]
MLRDTPQPIHLKDYRPPEYLVDETRLEIRLGEEETLVRSRLLLRRNPARPDAGDTLRLDGERLELRRLALDGRELPEGAYEVDDGGLTVHRVPDRFELESEVAIRPQENTALEGLYRSGGLYCTQCEAEGFRRITWYPDRPDVMSRFTTTIEADRERCPVLLSNGNPVREESLPGGRHRVTWEDPFPKPCYLFALVAGDLRMVEDSFTTASGRQVALRIYVEPENLDKCGHAMRSLQQAMAWDERNYGREYDLDIYMIVAVNDFNMGAMENKGLNIFNAKYVLARPDSATDRDFQGIEGVIAHEYFHNWTGNRITCRDWFQLSLKEGLTVFRDQEFSADMGSRGVKRIEDVRLLRAHQFAEDAGPMAHPVRPDSYIEINNFYTVTVYEKGAEVVRMQHTLLGPERFRRGMDLYFRRFDGQAVTTDDFVQCMADAGGRDLEQFKRWYDQAGTPELTVSDHFDAAGGVYTLEVSQSCPPTPGQPEKLPFHIPLAVGLLDRESGAELALRLEGETEETVGTRVLELREERQRFRFTGLHRRPVPSLLRGFSAPVKLRFDYSDDDLMFLMARDSDGFNRWDAAQLLAQRLLLRRVAGEESPAEARYIEAFARALDDQEADQALLAEVLILPSESYLGDQMEEVDVDGIHAAREDLRRRLSEALRDRFLARYRACREQGPYRLTPADIGRRRLKNLCLDYLMQSPDAAIGALCRDQFQAQHNMTDVMAALSLIAGSDMAEREQLLQEFYRRWRHDPLVLDKWFTVQAVSKREDTLQRVESLLQHPDFSLTNPNRVRSLVGAFCSGNPVRFHDAGGAGYRFLADRVLELDPLNPQIASRLLRVMARWRRYDPARQSLMKGQLERILGHEGLSRDVYEIASRSLGE